MISCVILISLRVSLQSDRISIACVTFNRAHVPLSQCPHIRDFRQKGEAVALLYFANKCHIFMEK